MKKFMTILFSLIFISGCASTAYKNSLKNLPEHDFSVEIPHGWWQPQNINKYLITKDGPFKQYVLIQQRPIEQPFKHTKKTLREGMLPQESAEIIIDEIALDRNIRNFKVLENEPTVIDGHEGFKILFSYKDKKGSSFKTLYYGLIDSNSFFSLRYNAAIQNYFEKDIADFKQIISSFKLVKNKAT